MLLRIRDMLELDAEPLNENDFKGLMYFVLDVIPHFQRSKQRLKTNVAVAFLQILDHFFIYDYSPLVMFRDLFIGE